MGSRTGQGGGGVDGSGVCNEEFELGEGLSRGRRCMGEESREEQAINRVFSSDDAVEDRKAAMVKKDGLVLDCRSGV